MKKHIDYYKSLILDNSGSCSGSGGITPTGTLEINIQENGVTTHDVTNYAEASVTVDVPEPSGEIDIVTNGKHDVSQYATANVNVPTTEPSGTADLAYTMDKGVYSLDETADVSGKANAHVTVDASALEPSGEKSLRYAITPANKPFDIFEADEDVKGYATAHVRIDTTGLAPKGTKEVSVTQNGEVTEDVADYASVHITTNVESSEDTLTMALKNQLDSYTNDSLYTVYDYGLAGFHLKEISLPNCTQISDYGLYNETSLETVNLPKLGRCGNYAFGLADSEGALKEITLPKLSELYNANSLNRYCDGLFIGRTGLQKVTLPKLRTLGNSFTNSTALKLHTIDMLGGGKFCIHNGYIQNKLDIVFRDEKYVTVFGNTYYKPEFPNEYAIYVPDNMVDSYKTATGWSGVADHIFPLSEYVPQEVV